MKQNLKILIIEDHELVQWAVSEIVRENIPNSETHSAPTFEHGLHYLENNSINLVILDIDVPGGNNPKMITLIREIRPGVRVLIHTGLSEKDFSLNYLSAGADGFVSKNAPLGAVKEAVLTVLAGEKYISESTQRLIDCKQSQKASDIVVRRGVLLSSREAEIVHLMLNGKWTKEIGAELGIKWSTVSTHKMKIFEKFGVENLIQLYQIVEKEMPELIVSKYINKIIEK